MSDTVTAADLPDEFDIAITVFARARGTDFGDASDRVKVAIRDILRSHRTRDSGPDIKLLLPHREGFVLGADFSVTEIMSVGAAARNGYLLVRPTNLAFRELDRED